MRRVTLTRETTGLTGTFGILRSSDGFSCRTGELPWRGNSAKTSSIPPGVYQCTWRTSPAHGDCYHVDGVPGRTQILIHAGNWCGDTGVGLRSDVLGCIILGKTVELVKGQLGVTASKATVAGFVKHMQREDFELVIEGP